MVGMHRTMFPTIDFLANKILSILRSQIETERIFSLMGILINLMKYLQLKNLEKLILWEIFDQMIVKLVVKSPFNLVELIEKDLNLEKEF
jgi:hypothetical protein